MPVYFIGDTARIRQILVNLLSNAVKFTSHGEVIAEISGARQQENRYQLRLAVRDTGLGIPPERRHRLFEVFSQVDASTTRVYGGTGLGLAICKRLAEAMHGDIEVQSTVGVGSTFIVTLPMEQATPDRAVSRAEAFDPARVTGRRILIVKENDTARRALRQYCESWGMSVVDAASAEEALRRVRDDQPFDLALIDCASPSWDGSQLARDIDASSGSPIKILLLAMQGTVEEISRTAGRNVQGVLAKPLHQSHLYDALVGVLASPLETLSLPYSSTRPPMQAQLRILLAEDNVVNQRLAQLLLERLNQTADIVSNGVEAVNATLQLPYDLILMDVLMPEMDGLDATREIRAKLPKQRQPRIVAMTANALTGDRERCLAAGMDDYISKPVQLEELARVLQRQQMHIGAAAGLATETSNIGAQFRQEVIDQLVSAAGPIGAGLVLGAMIDSAPKQLEHLRSAWSAGDASTFRRNAHSLKANAATVGADALARTFQELEDLGAADNLDAAKDKVTPALRGYQSLIAAIKEVRERFGK